MSNLLVANSVSKSFGNFKALNNVSISVPTGSIFGLLGLMEQGKQHLLELSIKLQCQMKVA